MADLDFAFDDDVFIQKAERKLPVVQTSYDAKEETDGWFHNFKDYESLMHEKLGPIQLKSAVEHDYLHKRYDRALEGALAYIKVVESGSVKITTAREMCETAVHCAVRLGKFDVAGKLLDKTTSSSELGTLQLQGKVYPLCGRPRDGVAALVRYNSVRRSDYQTYKQLALIFYNPEQVGCMCNHLARMCIERARKIMTTTRWALNVEHVRRRYEHELQELDRKLDQIIKSGGESSCFVTWMQQQQRDAPISAEQLATVDLDAYNPDDIEAIYKHLVKHNDDATEDVNDSRNVREL